MCCGNKIAAYCSDVSGAFDKVKAEKLVCKLQCYGVEPSVLEVLKSWLETRHANVIVESEMSKNMTLENMVYQGTVFGPPLWNTHYGDASSAVNKNDFTEVVFADDLNAFKAFANNVPDDVLHDGMQVCQTNVHAWGRGNQVSFDPLKESKHILATQGRGSGGSFLLLGVTFDTGLTMAEEMHNLINALTWKIGTINRTGKFFPARDLINLYKSKILSFVECRTAAIYHTCDTYLDRLDALQTRFLREHALTEIQGLVEHNLAPLSTRRDIAMLGLIHRAVLGKGPEHFSRFFRLAPTTSLKKTRLQQRRHTRQLVELQDFAHLEIARRSAIGLISIYNLLPQGAVDNECVSAFQAYLQNMVKHNAIRGHEEWRRWFSPRLPLHCHPLAQSQKCRLVI